MINVSKETPRLQHVSNVSGEYVGVPVVPPPAVRKLVRLPPSPPFYLQAHPERWMLVDNGAGTEWLPLLGYLRIEPGLNRVDHRGDHTLASVHNTKVGWTIIPWDVIPDGYVRAYEGERGKVHLTKWEVPRQVGQRTIIESDTVGYYDFLRMLLQRGIIPKPDIAVLEGYIDLERKRCDAIASKPDTEGNRQLLKQAQDKLQKMIDATSKLREAKVKHVNKD